MSLVTVTGVRGAQQRAIAAAFRNAGWSIRPTARTAAETPYGPAAVADLKSGEGVAAAFEGADAVAFTLPQDHTPGAAVAMARTVAEAAAAANVPLLVVNYATFIPDDAEGSLFDDLRTVRSIVRGSGVPVAEIETTVFMDNLQAPWAREAIGNGVFPYPIAAGVRVAWISHASLAEAVVAAAGKGAGAWRVGGPAALTGDETAAAIASATGRPVRFVSLPLDGFAAGIDAAFGAPAGERIASLYAYAARNPDALDFGSAGAEALGVRPETMAGFLRRERLDAAA